jgi:guanylate kinase
VAARQERAKVKEQITKGEIFFFDLFVDDRKSITRMKLVDLLQSVPGIGQSRAEIILERTGISPSRRIGGVGHRQLELLRQEFLLIKNSRKSGKLLVVSGPSGVGKSTITNKLRGDERFWISISATTRKMRTGEVDGVDAFKKRTEVTVKIQSIEEVEKELLNTLSSLKSKAIDVEAKDVTPKK